MAPPARVDDSAPPYGTLVFDCDSTLASIEGIDELAGERKQEIAALTERAMAGEVPLEAVFRRRLLLLEPTRDQVAALGRQYVAHALPHARELVRALQALGKRVCILSGGLRQAVFALSDALGIDSGDVFAVDIFHGRDGSYAGFDEDSPLARSGGKLELLRQLAREDRRGGLALVGDGATDLEAAPAARRFVAFGGVARRKEVFARAVVTCDTPDLAALLPLLVATDEIDTLARDPSHHLLLRAARVAR
ncbi:MAG: HAD-IB family phosphatase [Planctomycetes bacterium]|nr:HAD-IB family phosphatase [Planctomycetota bacterium]